MAKRYFPCTSIKVRNDKLFHDHALELSDFKRINVFVGPNSQGKSLALETLIRIIKSNPLLTALEYSQEALKSNSGLYFVGDAPMQPAANRLDQAFPTLFQPQKQLSITIDLPFGGTLHLGSLTQTPKGFKRIYFGNPESDTVASMTVDSLEELTTYQNLNFEHLEKILPRIVQLSATRSIQPEPRVSSGAQPTLQADGTHATQILELCLTTNQSESLYHEDLVRNQLLPPLQELTQGILPIIDLKPYRCQNNPDLVEINLILQDQQAVPLSQAGSGIKHLLLILMSLYLVPALSSKKVEECLFALEEIENGLHPTLQKRLAEHLNHFSEQHQVGILLTTHAAEIIDGLTAHNQEELTITEFCYPSSSSFSYSSLVQHQAQLTNQGLSLSSLIFSPVTIYVPSNIEARIIEHWLQCYCQTQETSYENNLHYRYQNYCDSYGLFLEPSLEFLADHNKSFWVFPQEVLTNPSLKSIKSQLKKEQRAWLSHGLTLFHDIPPAIISQAYSNESPPQKPKPNVDIFSPKSSYLKKCSQNQIDGRVSRHTLLQQISPYLTPTLLESSLPQKQLACLYQHLKRWNPHKKI